MTAPESVRDRLERRARELRVDAIARTDALIDGELTGRQVAEVGALLGTACALEEVVAALDGASAWLAGNPGGENGRRSEHEPVGDDLGGEDVSPGGSA